EHAQTVEALRSEHARQAETLRDENTKAIEALGHEHAQAVEALEREHAQTIETTKREHAQAIETTKREHAQAIEAEAQTHRAERERVQAELGETQAAHARDEERIAALEADNVAFQEQILKAYHRLKTDENVVARARKALAIALTLLDENGEKRA